MTSAPDRLADIAALPNGWDGYLSPAPTQAAVLNAERVLRYMERCARYRPGIPDPVLAPSPEGGVQVEWVTGSEELDVYCTPGGGFELYRARPGKYELEYDGDFVDARAEILTFAMTAGDAQRRGRPHP